MFSVKKDCIAKFVSEPKLPFDFYKMLGLSVLGSAMSIACPFLSLPFYVWQFITYMSLITAWLIYKSWQVDVKLHRYNLRQMLEFAQKHPDYIAKLMGK